MGGKRSVRFSNATQWEVMLLFPIFFFLFFFFLSLSVGCVGAWGAMNMIRNINKEAIQRIHLRHSKNKTTHEEIIKKKSNKQTKKRTNYAVLNNEFVKDL
jgi:hypothetical protein